jgi:hypothetical protein
MAGKVLSLAVMSGSRDELLMTSHVPRLTSAFQRLILWVSTPSGIITSHAPHLLDRSVRAIEGLPLRPIKEEDEPVLGGESQIVRKLK